MVYYLFIYLFSAIWLVAYVQVKGKGPESRGSVHGNDECSPSSQAWEQYNKPDVTKGGLGTWCSLCGSPSKVVLSSSLGHESFHFVPCIPPFFLGCFGLFMIGKGFIIISFGYMGPSRCTYYFKRSLIICTSKKPLKAERNTIIHVLVALSI